MTKTITIARREQKTINGRDILNIWDKAGVRYTHFIEPKNEGWEEMLQIGNQIRVDATEKENPNNPKYPYRNIYKPKGGEEVAVIESPRPEESATDAEMERSDKIRWMNSLNNACRLAQGQVVLIDRKNPINSIVQLANVLYKVEPNK
jgi:hypothetical protein